MKMKDGSTNGGAAVVGTERGGGRGTVMTAEWVYLSAQPLFSILICKSSVGRLTSLS